MVESQLPYTTRCRHSNRRHGNDRSRSPTAVQSWLVGCGFSAFATESGIDEAATKRLAPKSAASSPPACALPEGENAQSRAEQTLSRRRRIISMDSRTGLVSPVAMASAKHLGQVPGSSPLRRVSLSIGLETLQCVASGGLQQSVLDMPLFEMCDHERLRDQRADGLRYVVNGKVIRRSDSLSILKGKGTSKDTKPA
ncbi:hypothetical protein SAMN05446935_9508 [Burkholderia sp. YR290]|nr:hypothetical protein SAMN05446934_7000 [Paraburkholderia hospita]SOE90226.1 hypothetical protein SAMN05446935_9508 [Burkholderia sp. YR290]